MTEDEHHELKDAAIALLVKVAARTSASYEYEIDTLREALRGLVGHVERDDAWDADKVQAFSAAIKAARAAIDRTDWRAP